MEVPRPEYDGVAAGEAADVETQEEEGEEAEADEEADASEEPKTKSKSKSSGKLDRFKMKANHEATSDEDEG